MSFIQVCNGLSKVVFLDLASRFMFEWTTSLLEAIKSPLSDVVTVPFESWICNAESQSFMEKSKFPMKGIRLCRHFQLDIVTDRPHISRLRSPEIVNYIREIA